MDIQQLKSFVCVAKYLNFTQASNELYLAQSTISRQILELEKKIGVKLFERDSHSVCLTEAGDFLLEEAKMLIDRWESVKQKTRQIGTGKSGNINIGYLNLPIKNLLPKVFSEFNIAYPHIKLNLKQKSPKALYLMLESGNLDICFVPYYDIKDDKLFSYTTVLHDSMCLVLRKDHFLASEDTIDFNKIAHQPFIAISNENAPSSAKQLQQFCSSRGFVQNIVSEVPHMEMLILMIESGMGIAFLPKSVESYASNLLIFKEIKEVTFDWVAAWKKNTTNPLIYLFIEQLSKCGVLSTS